VHRNLLAPWPTSAAVFKCDQQLKYEGKLKQKTYKLPDDRAVMRAAFETLQRAILFTQNNLNQKLTQRAASKKRGKPSCKVKTVFDKKKKKSGAVNVESWAAIAQSV
jgi:hypothetical protein